MSQYTIHASVNGRNRFVQLEASSKGEAIKLSGFGPSKIVSVKRHGFFLNLEPSPPSAQIQILVLSSLSSLIITSRLGDALDAVMKQEPSLRKFSEKVRGASTVSEALESMRFSKEIVAVVQAGEKAGRTSEVLRSLARFQIEIDRVRRSMSSGVLQGAVYAAMGILMTILMPWIYYDVLSTFMQIKELSVKPNAMTEMIFFFHWLYFENWFALVGLVGTIAVFRKPIWRTARKWPILNKFHHYATLKRSLNFLIGFIPVFENGLTTNEGVTLLTQNKSGSDLEAYKQLMAGLNRGYSLSESFERNREGWAPEIITGMAGLSEGTRQTQSESLHNMQEMLISILTMRGAMIGRILVSFGYALIFFSFVLAIVGGMWPIQSLDLNV